MQASGTGKIVILNGTPRAGKTSIVRAMQARLDGIWINLGVDVASQTVPARLQPGIGLRPGGERPDIEAHLPLLFAALAESVAAHSRLGLNVAVDVGFHQAYSQPLHLLHDVARRLLGLPVLVVGIHCPLAVILQRRAKPEPGREDLYVQAAPGQAAPTPVLAWQEAVHRPGIYDLKLDTSVLSPEECSDRISAMLQQGVKGPAAVERLAAESKHRS